MEVSLLASNRQLNDQPEGTIKVAFNLWMPDSPQKSIKLLGDYKVTNPLLFCLMGPIVGSFVMKKRIVAPLSGIELRPFRPTRRQPLY
jgi:hypothetical protein